MKPRLYQRFGWWYCEDKLALGLGADWRGAWQQWRALATARATKLKPKGA